jgi:hypothetical protein
MAEPELTTEQLEQRIAQLERELRLLREELWRRQGHTVIPGLGRAGVFKDDPGFDEIMRFVQEERERDRRETRAEMEREEAEERKRNGEPTVD